MNVRKLVREIRTAESYFVVGDFLRANDNAQGLVKGQIYTVVDIQEDQAHSGPWGTPTTYVVEDKDGKQLSIVNAHVLMSSAQGSI